MLLGGWKYVGRDKKKKTRDERGEMEQPLSDPVGVGGRGAVPLR